MLNKPWYHQHSLEQNPNNSLYIGENKGLENIVENAPERKVSLVKRAAMPVMSLLTVAGMALGSGSHTTTYEKPLPEHPNPAVEPYAGPTFTPENRQIQEKISSERWLLIFLSIHLPGIRDEIKGVDVLVLDDAYVGLNNNDPYVKAALGYNNKESIWISRTAYRTGTLLPREDAIDWFLHLTRRGLEYLRDKKDDGMRNDSTPYKDAGLEFTPSYGKVAAVNAACEFAWVPYFCTPNNDDLFAPVVESIYQEHGIQVNDIVHVPDLNYDGKPIGGQYFCEENIIRLRVLTRAMLEHETGHADDCLDDGISNGSKTLDIWDKLDIDSDKGWPSEYAKISEAEFYAEAFSMYMVQPKKLDEINPELYERMDQIVSKNKINRPGS